MSTLMKKRKIWADKEKEHAKPFWIFIDKDGINGADDAFSTLLVQRWASGNL